MANMEMKNELKATSIPIKIIESVHDDEESDEIEIISHLKKLHCKKVAFP